MANKKINELAEFISSSQYLISFDPMTAVVTEATFTNTPVLIQNTGNEPGQPEWNREEVEATGWVKNGVAWNKEEMEFARDTVHLAKDDYLELMQSYLRFKAANTFLDVFLFIPHRQQDR